MPTNSPTQAPLPAKITPAPAPPKKIVATPIMASPKNVTAPARKSRRGSGNCSRDRTSPHRAGCACRERPLQKCNVNAVPQTSGKSALWNQLLGVNPPTPPKTSTSPPATTLQTEPLQLASAEDETASQRLPTLADIEAAKTPATSMTISRPGLMERSGATSGQAVEPPTCSAYSPTYTATYPTTPPGPNYQTGLPPVPTVPTKMLSGITSALWRPLLMTNNAPTAAMPDEVAATMHPPATANLPESERVPSLLRPWYATNPPEPRGRRWVCHEHKRSPMRRRT